MALSDLLGYSWKSNQYGLTIDTVQAFNLVLPNGTITTATSSVNSDLFFALKGGFNNFGIVYSMTLQAVPQTQVWVRPSLCCSRNERLKICREAWPRILKIRFLPSLRRQQT